MILEILTVLLLTVINGLLAMSELAIVSARPAKLKVMAEQGSVGATTALTLAEDPGKFLSSVQIGITLVGVLAGAFSGATLGARLAGVLPDWGVPPGLAQPLGMGGVVLAITYLSLIVGELVPKQIALRAPEDVAARVAPAMRMVSRIAAPLVWLLDRSGQLVLGLLGQSGKAERDLSDEEIKMVISEAASAGVIEHAETQMIAGVMRIADRTARGLMTPRHEVVTVDTTDSLSELAERFRATRRSRLPVRDGDAENMIGVLTAADLLAADTSDAAFDIRALVHQTPVVHEGMDALAVIERLRESAVHMVLVYDEYGHFEGIITPMDLLEAITGEFSDSGSDDEPKMTLREDGSMLVAGWMQVDEFADRMGIKLEADREFETVAGLVLEVAGALPQVGDVVSIQGWRVEVVDLDGRRIDKLLVCKEK
jgi:putative hemolysin